jgi:hypothetical protein
MTFGKKLETEFYKLTSVKGKIGELKLFRYLMDAFNHVGGPQNVYEYHGSKHQVIYNSTMSTTLGHTHRCELCDLLIICYSKRFNKIRLTFLQNKVDDKAINHKRFKGNIKQWELLHRRPLISGVGRFNPPRGLLQSAILPSVGSFGIFYNDSSGYSMVYSIADLISPYTTTAKSVNRMLNIDGNYMSIRSKKGYREVEACDNLQDFGNCIRKMIIGTPLLAYRNHLNEYRMLYAMLSDLIENNLSSPVISEFKDVLERDMNKSEIEFHQSDENLFDKDEVKNTKMKRLKTNVLVISTDNLDENNYFE